MDEWRAQQQPTLHNLSDKLELAISVDLEHALALIDEHTVLKASEKNFSAGVTVGADVVRGRRDRDESDEE